MTDKKDLKTMPYGIRLAYDGGLDRNGRSIMVPAKVLNVYKGFTPPYWITTKNNDNMFRYSPHIHPRGPEFIRSHYKMSRTCD